MGHDEAKWLLPMLIDKVTDAFPIHIKHLMPTYDEIPSDFRDVHAIRGKQLDSPAKWLRFQDDWLKYGFADLKISPKEGVDPKVALKHLAVIQGSYEPKYEHKVAAVAYLASLWFDDVLYKTKKEIH
jgi:hypothetical protein